MGSEQNQNHDLQRKCTLYSWSLAGAGHARVFWAPRRAIGVLERIFRSVNRIHDAGRIPADDRRRVLFKRGRDIGLGPTSHKYPDYTLALSVCFLDFPVHPGPRVCLTAD